jgi:hypothetical protein
MLALFTGILSGSAFAAGFEGPLQVRNQFPLFLALAPPFIEQASTESSISISLSHSSVYVVEESPQWTAHLDLELTELNIRCKKDFAALFELGIDVPVLRAARGFMDRPLAGYHRTFGFPDYGRSERPDNAFLYTATRNGQPVIQGEDGRAGLGDVKITFKKKLGEGTRVWSLMASLEVPTGNAKVGYGSGSLDSGAALLLDQDLADSFRLYVNAGVVFPGDLKAHQTVSLDTYYYGGAGIEYRATDRFGLLVQTTAATSPYPRTEISQIDTPGILLVMGGRYRFDPGSLEFSLTEDPNTSGAPDFVLNVSFKHTF